MQETLARCWELVTTVIVKIPKGCTVKKESINNEIGSIIHYMGKKPYFVIPETSPEPWQVGGCI